MTGVLALVSAAAAGVANDAWALHVEDVSISTPGVRTVSVTFGTDGTASCVGAGSAPNWFLPTLVGVGATWSVRVVAVDSFNTTTSGSALDTWHSLAAAKTFGWSNSGSGQEGEGSATVEFSPDAGFSVAAGGVVTWAVGYRV